ncbi:MAG: hypothetical protein RIS94_2041 [Pseudomonadota bacterium]|jgi:hypothetical protein
MIARVPASSWQTILADLALILFLVTASALANAPDAPLGPDTSPPPARPAPKPAAPSPRAEPVGVWTDGPGAPPLAQWLAASAADPRLRVTIAVRYARDSRAAALARAARLGEAAGPRAATARMVVEPGSTDAASVALGYDAEASGTALALTGA